jgi:hypothetical protein
VCDSSWPKESIDVSADKLPSTIAREQASKILATILHEAYPSLAFFALKRECSVALEWKHIATIDYPEEERNVKAVWNKELCQLHSIDWGAMDVALSARATQRRTPWG